MTTPPPDQKGEPRGATALELRIFEGRTYLAVDSLVDMFEGVAGSFTDQTDDRTVQLLHALAAQFRPMTIYATQEDLEPDEPETPLEVRQCACGVNVVDALTFAGSTVTVDAEPSDDGQLVPTSGMRGGAMKLVAYDRTVMPDTVTRVRHHLCGRPS